MTRTTIDFGIDLGTTNSAIAVLRGTDVEVFKNNEGMEYTPSAVAMDKSGALFVGRRAKQRVESDPDNSHAEFKIEMGANTARKFSQTGREMRPEELSAEVLKELKAHVSQRSGEDVPAAVITVPAAFELPQCEATKKAAQLAGFAVSPLLQEPVAAALAYGFQSESDKVFWLVYDLGGGTFDSAIMQVRDGVIQVVNHGGDNHLGGKLIDWEIVNQLLIPAVTRQHSLKDFRRGNPKWRQAFAKLKQAAEEAKIQVSRAESAEIVNDFLCQDEQGKPVQFEYTLKKSDVERLAEPFILQSINICKKVLKEKRLGAGDIEKVLLVGGPTLMPYLRDRLLDRSQGLGIPLEFRVNPLTIVAQGAAIFAGTQRLEGVKAAPAAAGQFSLELEYKPVGADTEPLVGGRVVAGGGQSVAGFTVEFVNAEAKPPWRSGKLGLAPNGTFVTNLWAEKGRPNTFVIELRDAAGTQHQTVPDRLTYTVGLAITDPPLIHSVGIALATGEMKAFFEKGKPLPVRRRDIVRVAHDVRRGKGEDVIKIPVVEGENVRRADRNDEIGSLEIPGDKLKRDVPAGSEIEVTIEIDQSRLIRTKAYIPILDEEFETVIKLEKKSADPKVLTQDFKKEQERLEAIRKKAEQARDPKAQEALARIDGERMQHDVEASLAAASTDREAQDKCDKSLRKLKSAVDEVEDALEWPGLVTEAEEEMESLKTVAQNYGNSSDKQMAATLERDTRQAMERRDTELLRRKIAEMAGVRFRILREQPGFWVALLQQLEGRKAHMREPGQAEQYFAQGNRAILNNDVPSLKSAVQQLIGLLPADEQQAVRRGFGSSVV